MKVKVLGKFNYKGTGKQSGKPYTCVKVFVSAPLRDGEGESAELISLFDTDFASIRVGGSYDMEYNRKGFVDTFTPAK